MKVSKPKAVVVGCFQNGKSTLVNCLLDDYVSPTGIGLPTTHLTTTYTYGELEIVNLKHSDGTEHLTDLAGFLQKYEQGQLQAFTSVSIMLWKPLLEYIDLMDTPGLDAGNLDTNRALTAIEEADFAILILSNRGLRQVEQDVLRKINRAGKPCSVLFNCTDLQRWDPASDSNHNIVAEIQAAILQMGLKPFEVVPGFPVWRCNLAWFWEASGHLDREIQNRKHQMSEVTPYLLENAERLWDAVDMFLKRNGGHPGRIELAKRSQFLEIRDGLCECFWKSLSITEPAMRRVLDRSVESWRIQLRLAVESAKAHIAK
jgi:hypothetical protein